MNEHIKIYSSDKCLAHDTGAGHPERAERLQTLLDLINKPAFASIEKIEPSPATDEDILRVHSAAHLSVLSESDPYEDGVYEHIDKDTLMSFHSLRAARLASGGVVTAVKNIHAQSAKVGLCITRPPGHHATHDQAMGFCLLNNVMIGAAQAAELGFERIAVIDFDVHHGNGCQDILNHVELPCFYISTHQDKHYPQTGLVDENVDEKILNVPLAAGADGDALKAAYKESILPALDAYKPDIVFISAGFDGHKDDPYADFNLNEDDYTWLTHHLYAIAIKHAEGRIVSVLEGGYDLKALKNSYAAHIKAFM
jgi:acetoin utilization deacetylase AcuC-like enzyme